MKSKKILTIAMVLALTLFVYGCTRPSGEANNSTNNSTNNNGSSSDQTYEFEVGHVVTTDHSYHLGLVKFAEVVSEKSNGRVKINIFPSGQLGNERDLVEGLTMGTIDMALSNSGNLATFTDSYQVFDLPFLFRDNKHAHAVLDSEIGQNALKSLEDVGIKGLANWENGFFSTWNNKRSIDKPEDIKGLKIRANDNPIHIDSYGQLGVSAITMGWSEVYTAIQNGTVDGVSVSIPSMYTAKIQEVAPYISTSGEFYVTVILMMNKDLFDKLPADLQQVMVDSANEVTEYQRNLNAEIEVKALKDLEEKGFIITHPDKEAFKAASFQAIYDKYAEKLGKDIIDSIQKDY